MMPFDTEIYAQRYCSPSHKTMAYRLRKAEREAQVELE
jgi:hypothetical protein